MPSRGPRRKSAERACAGVPGWLEVRCSLFPQQAGPRFFVAWSALGEALERWRAEGRYRWCFFVRKPPGLRLRFAGEDLAGRLEPVLLPWLAEAERRNDVRGFRFAIYEPEEARFGGPVGMAIAHDAFDGDSRDAIRYETLAEDQRRGFSRAELSVAVCSHLFRHSLGDHAEIWDVWQRLRRVLEGHALAPMTGALPADRLKVLASGACPDLAPDARRLLEQRFEDNLRLAAAIAAAHNGGRLSVGVRSWLTAVTIFHWNRLGLVLALNDLSFLVSELCRILEPDA